MADDSLPVARPADADALARELVSALSALATPPPGSPPAAPQGPAVGAGNVSLAGPRQILENASRFVSPRLPADARMRGLKALVLRALRIVTRDQGVFNVSLVESLRSALAEVESVLGREAARGDEQAAALRALEGRTASERAALADRQDRDARRLEERIAGETEALRRELERQGSARNALGAEVVANQARLAALEAGRDLAASELSETRRRLETVETTAREAARLAETVRLLRLEWSALRGSLSSGAAVPAPGAPTPATAAPTFAQAGVYAEFEETFRGSEGEIRERQRKDLSLFAGLPGPVADLGCGRGEFLEVLAGAGIAGLGCDTNPVMVARAREKGLAVDEADLFSWLAARSDASLGGVSAYQVIEHLPALMLLPLAELVAKKLAPGGRVLFETVNPESVYAMRWFWMDLTHVRPVPAPAIAQLLTSVGFRNVTVDFRSPVPAADALPPGADPALEPVSRLLFGPQDFAVTGVR